MQSSRSPRFQLPLLAVGQSQKELYHNEALARLDFIVHPVVQSVENDPGTLTLKEGLSWLIDSSPVGKWEGKANHIASWTAGGWRFVKPVDFMQIYVLGFHEIAVFRANQWKTGGSIAAPAGGSTIDIEARATIDSILEALRLKGMIVG